jgi:uncharacterized protein YceH (UPF0502 family)
MGLFSKKSKVVDYTYAEGVERNKRIADKGSRSSANTSTSLTSSAGQTSDSSYAPFPFFSGNTDSSGSTNSNSYSDDSNNLDEEERKRRLGKRLLDMTNRIEDLSNQIYHLQQRIELLERKSGDSSSSSDSWGY